MDSGFRHTRSSTLAIDRLLLYVRVYEVPGRSCFVVGSAVGACSDLCDLTRFRFEAVVFVEGLSGACIRWPFAHTARRTAKDKRECPCDFRVERKGWVYALARDVYVRRRWRCCGIELLMRAPL